MPPNRKRHAVDSAANERWALLGRLFRARRTELGYAFRPAFAEARLPKTQDGNTMIRMVVTVENNERPGTYAPGRLEQFAQAYAVTLESVHAVLRGDADKLEPAPPAATRRTPPPALPGDAADPPGWPPARVAADRPFFDPINERRVELAARGIAYPTGAQMFGEGTEDAEAWDGDFAPLPVGDKVWAVADMRRRAAARAAGPQANDRGA